MSSTQKETTDETTHQEQGAEQWVRDAGKGLYDSAAGAIPKNWKAYKGERVADYGEDFYEARDRVRNMEVDTPELKQFQSVLQQLYDKDSAYLKNGVEKNMNPFIDAVLSPQLRKLDEARKLQLNEDDARATMSGAFGDPQAGIARSLSNDRYNTQTSDATGAAYKDGWDRAQNQENIAAARFSDTGKGFATLDQAKFNKGTALAQFLTKFGLADQELRQAKDDVKYDDWKMDKQGGWEMLRGTNLMNLLNATPHKTIMDGTRHSEKETDDGGAGAMAMIGKVVGAAVGGIAGGPAGASMGASLFGGGGGGGSSGGGSSGGGSFFDPNGSVVNNASTGGQAEWAPQYAGYSSGNYFRT
jgi:hypothetical protein